MSGDIFNGRLEIKATQVRGHFNGRQEMKSDLCPWDLLTRAKQFYRE